MPPQGPFAQVLPRDWTAYVIRCLADDDQKPATAARSARLRINAVNQVDPSLNFQESIPVDHQAGERKRSLPAQSFDRGHTMIADSNSNIAWHRVQLKKNREALKALEIARFRVGEMTGRGRPCATKGARQSQAQDRRIPAMHRRSRAPHQASARDRPAKPCAGELGQLGRLRETRQAPRGRKARLAIHPPPRARRRTCPAEATKRAQADCVAWRQ